MSEVGKQLGSLVEPKDSPTEPFGLSLAIFVIGAGVALLSTFVLWEHRRETAGQDPLVHLDLLRIPVLWAGLATCCR